MPVAQILDELGKVADVAADAVEAVDHDGGKGDLLRVLSWADVQTLRVRS